MRPATTDYVKQQGLSLRQLAAVELLVGGATDTETASKIGAHRVTITKWRLYDPAFQAELARRRQELWAAAADRLRSLVPRALVALERELDRGAGAGRAAVEVLRLAGVGQVQPEPGPTEAGEALAQRIRRRAEKAAMERAARAWPGGMVPLGEGEPTAEDLRRAEREVAAEVEDARAGEPEGAAGRAGGEEAAQQG